MSFGPSAQEKTAQSNQTAIAGQAGQLANTAQTNSAGYNAAGNNLMNLGGSNVASGTNYFNTLLNGNAANTNAMLQPNIDQIKAANQNQIQSLSTLMPRGGGRFGTLFGASYAPNQQIQSMFNGQRGNAASGLAGIGLQQQGMGTNLFNTANSALNVANSAFGTGLTGNQNVNQDAFNNRAYSNSMWGQLGGGLVGLASLGATGGLGGTVQNWFG